jgi:hypothetical protein
VFFKVLAEICVIPLLALRMPDEEAVKRAAITGLGPWTGQRRNIRAYS